MNPMSRTGPLGCATAISRFIFANGLRLHALEWGVHRDRGLLFLHGGAAHCHWFDAVAPSFADRFDVISLDQRGHGESEWPDPPAYRTQDFSEDLQHLLDALGWRETVLVGHSMGGHNAMAFAAWQPERVRGLVIVDSRPSIPPDRLSNLQARGYRPLRTYESAESAVERFRLLPRETVADPHLLRHLARAGIVKRGAHWIYRFDPACNGTRQPVDAWPLLSRIAAPTLIVRGEMSPILPRQMAADMVSRILGARLEEVPGSYHHLMLDRPGTFGSILDRFVSALP